MAYFDQHDIDASTLNAIYRGFEMKSRQLQNETDIAAYICGCLTVREELIESRNKEETNGEM